jgi:hypothetical protein
MKFELPTDTEFDDSLIHDFVNQSMRELYAKKEAELKTFIKERKTHRMNVFMTQDVYRLEGNTLHVSCNLGTYKPKGWVAPIPD